MGATTRSSHCLVKLWPAGQCISSRSLKVSVISVQILHPDPLSETILMDLYLSRVIGLDVLLLKKDCSYLFFFIC